MNEHHPRLAASQGYTVLSLDSLHKDDRPTQCDYCQDAATHALDANTLYLGACDRCDPFDFSTELYDDATFEHDTAHADVFIDACPACHDTLAMLDREIESYLADATLQLTATTLAEALAAKTEFEARGSTTLWHEGHYGPYSSNHEAFKDSPSLPPSTPSCTETLIIKRLADGTVAVTPSGRCSCGGTTHSPRCLCEQDSICVAHYRAKVRYEHEASVAEDGTLIEIEPPEFSDYALEHVYSVYHRCPATIHFARLALDEQLAPDPTVTGDEGRDVESMEQHDHRQFIVHRGHVGQPWHRDYDEGAGYLPIPGEELSDAAYDREYAKPSTITVEAVKVDEYGEHRQVMEVAILLETEIRIVRDDSPEYEALAAEGEIIGETPAMDERLTMGSVAWEYRRRSQGREPWMSPATYRFVKDQQRAYERTKRLRTRIAALVRALGQDPRRPEIATWVKERGYEAAALALEVRAQREGVTV